MNYNDLPVFYKKLAGNYNVVNGELESATYTNVDSNFVFSSDFARHRWFNYKEGFSPILVEKIFEEYDIDKNCIVCDPFCGAGTTLTVAQKHGINSIGFEVNPFAAFITKVKRAYDNGKRAADRNKEKGRSVLPRVNRSRRTVIEL